MKAVYKKDLKSAFTGMIGWVLCAFVVVVVGLYFTAICLQSGYADFSLVLYNTTFIFLVVVPLLTMRSIVEERRQKTDQLLLTSRASIAGIVWGKYLALVTVYAIPLAIVGICPLVMRAYGSVSRARSYAALLAFFLMGAAAIAIGLFMSSLTENQIIAAVCTFGSLLFLYLMPSIAGLISSSAAASLAAFTVLAALLALFLHWMTKSLVLPSAVFCVLEGGRRLFPQARVAGGSVPEASQQPGAVRPVRQFCQRPVRYFFPGVFCFRGAAVCVLHLPGV